MVSAHLLSIGEKIHSPEPRNSEESGLKGPAFELPKQESGSGRKAQGTVGSFAFCIIVQREGYKAQGLRLKAAKELSFNSAPCALRRLPYTVYTVST